MKEAYPNYKPSEVEWLGDIPSHWSIGKLGVCFEERNEKVSDRDYAALSVTKNGIVPQMKHVAVTDAGDNRKKVCIGDFVINSRSDRKGSSGTSCYEGSVSLISTVLKQKKFTPAFAHHLFRSSNFQEEFYRYGKGIVADLWSTRYAEMKSIPVPLIPEDEQISIAKYLDRETTRIDKLTAEKQRFIELLKEKRQALISHVVTKGLDPNVKMKDSGVELIGEVPEHWILRALKRDWSVIDCKHITAEFVEFGIPLVSISEVQSTHIETSNAKQTTDEFYQLLIEGGRIPQGGDMIFSRNATVGEVAIVPDIFEPFAMGQDVCMLRKTGSYDSKFMHYQLRSNTIIQQLEVLMVGATFRRINVDNIRNFSVLTPPYSEQIDIATYLDEQTTRINSILEEAEKSINLIKEHRTALISAAVTGKIDVRESA